MSERFKAQGHVLIFDGEAIATFYNGINAKAVAILLTDAIRTWEERWHGTFTELDTDGLAGAPSSDGPNDE